MVRQAQAGGGGGAVAKTTAMLGSSMTHSVKSSDDNSKRKIGEIVYRIYVYRDGKLVQINPQGEETFYFIIGIEALKVSRQQQLRLN